MRVSSYSASNYRDDVPSVFMQKSSTPLNDEKLRKMQPTRTSLPLAERRDCVAAVKAWFVTEWPNWYGPGGPGDIDQDLQAFAASSSALPVGMLVFEGSQLVGAAALKAESIPSHTHLGPWAGAGYVLPSHRGRGLGAFLLQSLVIKAHELGFSNVYCGTSTANSLLERAGWRLVETIEHDGKPLGIYRSAS
jgi:GNAT superfamily N-acetyltransferase